MGKASRKRNSKISIRNKTIVIRQAGKLAIQCPCCNTLKPSEEYLHNKDIHFVVCTSCGNIFMQKEFAKRVMYQLNETNQEVHAAVEKELTK